MLQHVLYKRSCLKTHYGIYLSALCVPHERIQNLNLPLSGVHNHQELVDVSHVGRKEYLDVYLMRTTCIIRIIKKCLYDSVIAL
jgi:hypothetical protein